MNIKTTTQVSLYSKATFYRRVMHGFRATAKSIYAKGKARYTMHPPVYSAVLYAEIPEVYHDPGKHDIF